MRIHALINYYVADLGTITQWSESKGHSITTTYVSEDQNFPEVNQFDLLIILGGVMAAYEEEEYPWLRKEKEFIKKAIDAEKGVLGICLGSQMIADSIGGKAYKQEHLELGWWNVKFTDEIKDIPVFKNLPTEMKFFQYHQDTFRLPPEVKSLAKSEACVNQAFVYGDRVVGLQFHPEFSEAKLQEIIDLFGDEIEEGPFAQPPETFLGQEKNIEKATSFLFTLLDNLEQVILQDVSNPVNMRV